MQAARIIRTEPIVCLLKFRDIFIHPFLNAEMHFRLYVSVNTLMVMQYITINNDGINEHLFDLKRAFNILIEPFNQDTDF